MGRTIYQYVGENGVDAMQSALAAFACSTQPDEKETEPCLSCRLLCRCYNKCMPQKIRITIKSIVLDGELLDTPCAKAVAGILPIETRPNEWGDEFYFEIPVSTPLDETATTNVKAGEIGYWPPGRALAIFFGPTPMSKGQDPVPASAVNIVGRITGGEATLLAQAKGAGKIMIEKS